MITKGVKVRGINQVKFLWIREREVMEKRPDFGFISVQSLSHFWLFTTPGLQHARPPVHHQLPEFTQTHFH